MGHGFLLFFRGEKNRRQDVARRSFFVRILYNDKEVSRTESRALSNDFKMHFGQMFNLKIVNLPQSINLQVIQRRVCPNFRLGSAHSLDGFLLERCVCVCVCCRCLKR